MGLNEDWYCGDDLGTLRGCASAQKDVPGLLLELGSWEGRSAIELAVIFRPRELVCVDLWPDNYLGLGKAVWPIFQENTAHLPSIIPVRQDIIAYCRGLSGPIAFAHVDAAHDYEHVRDTLVLLKPLCGPGSLLCGHDIRTPDVEKAVREILPQFGQAHNVWFWRPE